LENNDTKNVGGTAAYSDDMIILLLRNHILGCM
uniref:Reverse transcriptase domain-containing protein n=1 Tax=Mesocestoides corti TaxID=53468 RepID=A0A0R3U9T6_MESCO